MATNRLLASLAALTAAVLLVACRTPEVASSPTPSPGSGLSADVMPVFNAYKQHWAALVAATNDNNLGPLEKTDTADRFDSTKQRLDDMRSRGWVLKMELVDQPVPIIHINGSIANVTDDSTEHDHVTESSGKILVDETQQRHSVMEFVNDGTGWRFREDFVFSGQAPPSAAPGAGTPSGAAPAQPTK